MRCNRKLSYTVLYVVPFIFLNHVAQYYINATYIGCNESTPPNGHMVGTPRTSLLSGAADIRRNNNVIMAQNEVAMSFCVIMMLFLRRMSAVPENNDVLGVLIMWDSWAVRVKSDVQISMLNLILLKLFSVFATANHIWADMDERMMWSGKGRNLCVFREKMLYSGTNHICAYLYTFRLSCLSM